MIRAADLLEKQTLREGWRERRISELCVLVNGFPFASEDFEGAGEVPLVRIRDILSDDFDTFVPATSVPPSAVIQNGDLLVGMDGDFNTKIWARGPAALNQRLSVLRPTAGTDIRFVLYSLADHLKVVNDLTYATTVKHLSSGDVRAQRIPVPPLDEQRRIAEYLDRETGKIDELIAMQERLVDALTERRLAIVNEAVTRGIDRESRFRESGVYWLGMIPEAWAVRRFSQVARIAGGLVDPREEPFCSMVLIAPNHIEKATGTLLELETASEQGADSGKYFARKGSVLYSKIRPMLRKVAIAPVDCLCSADMYSINGEKNVLLNSFLQMLLLSDPFSNFAQDISARVAMPKVNREALGGAVLWFPSLEEQAKIVAHVAASLKKIDHVIAASIRVVERLSERRAALISAAVTGKIDVRGL